MLYNINMEFMQAFNPLYAVPIVAVIFCALIVFTFGFKSPIQPPSFEGLEEDKKSGKKRKTKEIQKSKLVANGKSNGIATSKGKVQETPRKKEIVDNSFTNEKPRNNEKTAVDKKVAKKVKPKTEKPQEKKKENVITDELNDDGWVQLVSKKGKKNRKKEDSIGPEVQSNLNQSPIRKSADTSAVLEVDTVPPNHVEVLNEIKKEMPEEKPLKKASKKDTPVMPSPEKPVKLDIAVEVKPVENYLEKESKQTANIPKASEDAGKSKKKKKKPGAASVVVEANSISAPPPVQVEPVSNIIEASPKIPSAPPKIPSAPPKIPSAPPKIPEPVLDFHVPVVMPDDSKTNVVFDELAGLYPEAKEKKKKKVRRDH